MKYLFQLLAFTFLLFINDKIFGQCGSQRWEVKTLTDAESGDVKFTPIKSTVSKQLLFIKPAFHLDNPRDSTEKRVYKIDCILLEYVQEGDSDWHLVVKDLVTNEKMVVEIPDTDCVDMSNPHFSKIDLSRRRLVAKVGPVKKTARVPPAGTKV